MVQRFCLIMGLLVCGLVGGIARGDTYKLADGQELVGEVLPSSANDAGVQVKVGEGEYKQVAWGNFSQEDLKRFAANPKLEAFVEPFIEVTKKEKLQKTEAKITQPPRLELLARRSLLGAMFSSGLGLVILLVLYAANVYAGYEVAIFRGQPVPLVCGVAAVLPLAGPAVFLAMRSRLEPSEVSAVVPPEGAAEGEAAAAMATAPGAAGETNPMRADGAAHPTSLRLAHLEGEEQQKPCCRLRQPSSAGNSPSTGASSRRSSSASSAWSGATRIRTWYWSLKRRAANTSASASAGLPPTTSTCRSRRAPPRRKS